MLNIDKESFIKVCKESGSMSDACRKLNMHFSTFRKYAAKFDCYWPNQGSKGLKKSSAKNSIALKEILDGKHPNYQTFKLKLRLIDEGIIKDECCKCGWSKKRPGEKYTPCELHHKDGNRFNHQLSNLELVCPNCHSLTSTYRSKNRKIEH